MRATKANKKKRAGRAGRRAVKRSGGFGVGALAMPEAELRLLVFNITARESVEPFVRRMVRLVDSLEAGRTRPLSQMLKRSLNPQDTRLLSALAAEAQSGSIVVARNTALWAAGCAYQNSLAYLFDLLHYLGHFRSTGRRPARTHAPSLNSLP